MGFSSGDGLEAEHKHTQQQQVELWPLEHPMEPLDEDRPIKCPLDESYVNNDGGMHKEQHGESSWRRRTHHHSSPAAARGGGRGTAVADAQPPRALRKRQLSDAAIGDHILTPLQAQNLTIFQMLHQLHKFQS